ncbi:MAG: cytochrome c maturation protein CcmE [Acidimicrobiia bacterium]
MTTVTEPDPPAPEARRPTVAPKRRGRYIAAASVCVIAVVAIVVLGVVLSDNVVYFRTVSEAVADRKALGTGRFRLAGAVVCGSVTETKRGVDFAVTDGKTTATVHHVGDPPDLFKEDAPVVVEGNWASPSANAPFDSDRILIKHGADYEPPKVNTKKACGS